MGYPADPGRRAGASDRWRRPASARANARAPGNPVGRRLFRRSSSRRAEQRTSEGQSLAQIARELNATETPTAHGGARWGGRQRCAPSLTACRLEQHTIARRRAPSVTSLVQTLVVMRMRRRLGAAQALDGLAALPLDPRNREQLEWLAEEVVEAGGDASIWGWRARFDAEARERFPSPASSWQRRSSAFSSPTTSRGARMDGIDGA